MSTTSNLAIVTGTARPLGIGRSIARCFCQNNYKVLGIDINPAEDLDKEPQSFGYNYHHHTCDLSSPAQISAVWDAAKNAFGTNSLHLHCLINNAAIADPSMPQNDPEARLNHWKKVIDTNLTGPFMLSETLLPHMQPGSSIIHISSIRALMSEPHCEAYHSAKAGLLGLTHSMSQSLAGKSIRVNAVLPGWIDTFGGAGLRPEDHEWHAVGRVGRPEDVAEMCLFLASDKAGFITGQEFIVDGGVTKKMVYPE